MSRYIDDYGVSWTSKTERDVYWREAKQHAADCECVPCEQRKGTYQPDDNDTLRRPIHGSEVE